MRSSGKVLKLKGGIVKGPFVECAISSDVHQITRVTEFMCGHYSPVGSRTESHAGKKGAKRGIDETESRLVGEVFFRSQDVDAQVAFRIAICHAIVSCQGKALVGIATLRVGNSVAEAA